MLSRKYKGYMEGADLTEIPMDYLAFPAKNVICHKGVAYTRPGIKNDGVAPTEDGKIVGEFVWKDAPGGKKFLRATQEGKLQLKYNGLWIDIFDGLTPGTNAVRFATWTDESGTIIKKRLFIVDGSENIYEWSGALAVIASIAGDTLTLDTTESSEILGFDPGSAMTPIDVQIVHFDGGVVDSIDDYTYEDDLTTPDEITLDSTPSPTPVADDILLASIITHSDKLTGFLKDDIYTFKNRLGVANFNSVRVYFSSVDTKLDFVIPAPGDRTALSPFFINLTGFYTAMISRFNPQTQDAVCWISSVDGWMKVRAFLEPDEFGFWVRADQVIEAESTGALPYAVADYKGDLIYFSQDATIQRVTSIDVLGKDTFELISDEVEGLLQRLDKTNLRIYYLSRYIEILFPSESIVVLLDLVEGHFETPLTIGASHISVSDGIQYGHSNTRCETFLMFNGRNDLGSRIEAKFAFGYYTGEDGQQMRSKSHTMMGVSGRTTQSTIATVEEFYETDGAKAVETFVIDGSKIKRYGVGEDYSWATHIFGDASNGGDSEASPLGRFLAYDKYNNVAWFDFRTIITVTGDEMEFHLLGWWIDDAMAARKIPEDLFIPKQTA